MPSIMSTPPKRASTISAMRDMLASSRKSSHISRSSCIWKYDQESSSVLMMGRARMQTMSIMLTTRRTMPRRMYLGAPSLPSNT